MESQPRREKIIKHSMRGLRTNQGRRLRCRKSNLRIMTKKIKRWKAKMEMHLLLRSLKVKKNHQEKIKNAISVAK